MHNPYVRGVLIFTVIGIFVAPLTVAAAYSGIGAGVVHFISQFFVFLGALGDNPSGKA